MHCIPERQESQLNLAIQIQFKNTDVIIIGVKRIKLTGDFKRF